MEKQIQISISSLSGGKYAVHARCSRPDEEGNMQTTYRNSKVVDTLDEAIEEAKKVEQNG